MSKFVDRINREYPVRRKPKEKEAFRLYLMGTLREMGYDPKLQTKETPLQVGGQVTNVVAGDPEKAKLLLIAHYDTGIRTIFPPLIMPTRPLTGFLYLALTPVCVLLGSLALSFALTFPFNAPQATLPLFLILLLSSLLYLRFGPSETNNLSDNTSGVAALLETASALTPHYRESVAFVFLDGGFGGMSGAKGFRAKYPSAKEKTVVNVNCVAQGDELMILPGKYVRWQGEVLDAILDSFDGEGNKTVFLKTDGLTYYPSDNRAFRYAISIFSCISLSGFGRIIKPKTAKSVDEENLKILKQGLCKLCENMSNI
ncbi:MAG: Zn-dependent exopeptidase M28 [Ruminococcaceae bacterium]|nr:Zn-dependent exopeptidase M28 [Oscillospiraceae bacterium]